jgi:hypothetical protein
MAGISRGSIQSYLYEFVWRKMKTKDRVDAFNELLQSIRKKCPIEDIDAENNSDFNFEEDAETTQFIEKFCPENSYDSDASIEIEDPEKTTDVDL